MTRRAWCLAAAAAIGLSACGGASHTSSATHATAAQSTAAPSTAATASGSRAVTGQLVGVTFGGPVLTGAVNLDRQLDAAVANGVESLRVEINWSQIQPFASASAVPAGARSQFQDAGGIPTRFGQLDPIVAGAAARGLSLLPVVEYTPSWDALRPGDGASPPRDPTAYARFLTALIGRYGPKGSFWASHPSLSRLPIRMWQIWNEPHFTSYWSARPFAPGYVKLLTAAHAAIKAADPGAKVVLAGLAEFSWQYLEQIYRVAAAKGQFDVVAIHPYTAQPAGVVTILQRDRAVMERFGDGAKPILATEVTWPSSQGKAPPQFGVSTTEQQQAARLGQLMPLLEAQRTRLGLMGFYWYTWIGDETRRAAPDAFDFAGLEKYVDGTVSSKPALGVFKHWALSLEGCRRKTTGTSCAS
jgi:hypothetical protein